MEDSQIKVEEHKGDAGDEVELHSDHGVEEPLNPGSKRSSTTSVNKKKKKEPLQLNLSLPYYSLCIGTTQFFLGVFLLLFGISAVATNAGMTKYTFGIFVGAAGTSAGVLGVLLAQMRRHDLVLASIIVSISAVLLALTTIIAACIGIKEDVVKRAEQIKRKDYLVDAMVNYDPPIALNSILIILSIFESIAATINVLFCSLFVNVYMKQKPVVVVESEKDFTDTNKPEPTVSAPKPAPARTEVKSQCGCTVYLNYNGAVGLRCGILQLAFGILILAFGIVNLCLNGWGSEFSIAVWGSLFVIIGGCLGIHSATDKRRDILICCCFFSVISCAAMTGLFITAAVASRYDFPQLPLGKVVVQIILMLFALAEFITGVFQATYCGKAFPSHDHNQLHYGRPTQGYAKPDCSVTCRSMAQHVTPAPPAAQPAPASNPMVILPLPGRAKDPFHINYGQVREGGFYVSVNERPPYVDEEGMDTSVHYGGKDTTKPEANV